MQLNELHRFVYHCSRLALYLTSSNKGCVSAMLMQAWHCSRLALYLTSSKTTLTDYQCVSTGCCTHVAKTEIAIDNQHVTKSLQTYRFLPKQPKENTEKITSLSHFLDFGWAWNAEMAKNRCY